MRIAVVTQYFPTSHQPWAGHSAYQTLRLLAEMHDLHVFYPDAKYIGWLQPKSTPLLANPTYHPAGVETTYVSYPAIPILSRPFNGWNASQRLLPYVRDFKPDVILSYTVYPDGFAALRIGEKLGVPVVLTAIGSDLNRISDSLCAALTRYTLKRASFTTTVSADLLNTARHMGASVERSSAILNGCNTQIFHPRDKLLARQKIGIQSDTEMLLYVGRLDVRKGLIELIEAATVLKHLRPKLCCYIVGDGPDKAVLMETIARYDASSWITLHPAQPTETIALWMSAADLFTLPSYKEGCPNVVIEALASGCPVVATNVGGIPELINERGDGYLVAPHSTDLLLQALDQALKTTWAPQQIARSHDRSWDDVAKQLEAILAYVVKDFLFSPAAKPKHAAVAK